MKYTVLGFQQQKLLEEELKVDDALILRTIKDMYSSASMEFIIEDKQKYMWINYSYLAAQIPIAGSKRTLMRRITTYEEKGLLDRKLKHEKGKSRGNFSYIAPTKKLDSLEDYTPYDKLSQGLCQNDIRVMSKRHNKDSSIRDTSIKDNKYIYSSIIDYLNKKADKNYKATTQSTKTKINARLNEGFTLEDFKKVIDVKCKQWKDTDMDKYLRPQTLFGTKFEGYLNEEVVAKENKETTANWREVTSDYDNKR